MTPTDHVFPVRVYWEDTDAGGIVYHTSYLRFLERGRTELLRTRGVEQQAMLAERAEAFAVRQMTIDFMRPARLDDLLDVHTRVEALGGASVTLVQEIRRGGEVLVLATMTIAFVSGGRPRRLPRALVSKLKAQA
jgi:acyl-CoA thioester hydrolase